MAPIMTRLEKLPKLSTVIEGGQKGADKLARIAADSIGLDVIEFPANWRGRLKAAGPYRNRLMLDLKPDLVIAFHEDIKNSKGTKDCVEEAKRRGIAIELHES
jgi:hypothetical protein